MSSVKQEKIQQHYDAVADRYDHHYDRARGRCYHTHLSRHIMEMLPDRGYLLDIGCGTGLFVDKYTAEGSTAVGIDISRGMIRQACRRCGGTDFIVGTGETLPFTDASFDAVASLLAFSYMKDPKGMLSEAYRVLKPGGSIAICTLGKKFLTRGIPALYHIGELMQVNHVVVKNFGEHYFDDNEMQELFAAAGFTDIGIKWCSFAHIDLIDPLFSLARRVEPFVERRLPQLAYNICVNGKKPDP
jgi:ubiquinone/menaquinone biosynthesis C-methylase UbiE